MLKVENLRLGFTSGKTTLVAVDGISFAIAKGETFALLGESGCGKSATAQGIMRLLPAAGRILDGQVSLDGETLRTHGFRLMVPPAGPVPLSGGVRRGVDATVDAVLARA